MSYPPNSGSALSWLNKGQNQAGYDQGVIQTLDDHSNEKFIISKLEVSNIKRSRKNSSADLPSYKTMTANGGCIAIATNNNTIIYYRLGSDPEEYELRRSESISKLFLDPSGNHLFISTDQGSFIYFSTESKKFVDIKSKIYVEAVGFSQESCEKTTYPFLIGTRNGVIYECNIEGDRDRGIKELFTLSDKWLIRGIDIEHIYTDTGSYYYILVVTSSMTRYYEFYGGTTLEECFTLYSAEKYGNYCDLPGTLSFTQLCTYHPPASASTMFAILLETGVHLGYFDFTNENRGKKIKDCETYLSEHTSNSSDLFLGIALSQFHIVLLSTKTLSIKSILTRKEVYKKNITEDILGICQDVNEHLIWIYTSNSIYELTMKNEDEDIWKLYLEKAQSSKDEHYFEIAAHYTHNDQERDDVNKAKAEYYFSEKKFKEAAETFAQTSCSLEEISLRFLDSNHKDSLLIYLRAKLGTYNTPDLRAQKILLCTWITEIFLDLINDYGVVDDNEPSELTDLVDEFNSFLQFNVNYLDEKTTYQLLLSHGRVDEMLHYATLIKDYDRVLAHYIQNQDFESALFVLKNLNASDNKEYLYYKYAPSLLIASPKETVDMWCDIKYLDPCKLIPALVRYMLDRQLHPPENEDEENQAIRYLEYLIHNNNNEGAIHNYLLYLYAHENYDEKLIEYLYEGEDNKYCYDKKYALRICLQEKKNDASIFLYCAQQMYDEAVEMTLSINDYDMEKKLNMAKKIANDVTDDDDKKRLWLMILKYIIENKDTATAIALLDECPLRIEDILPFFPNFTSIEDFKGPIIQSLEDYNQQIHDMKEEMERNKACTQKIRQDIQSLNTRYATISGAKRCESCHEPILSRTFYLFPCSHVFHEDCLKKEKSVRVNSLKTLKDGSELAKPYEEAKLDQECPLCGNLMIDTIAVPIAPANNNDNQWSFDL